MQLTIPELALVVLIGPSGAGKSTFARHHFKATEVLSSDACRALVADSETDQAATPEAFEILHFIAAKRLAAGRLTVIDATNVQPEARRPLLALARDYHCLAVAIVFDLPAAVCQAQNRQRSDRHVGASVIERQFQQLKRSLRSLRREGFRYIYTLSSTEEVATATIERQPLWSNHQHEHGPFDLIGDVHGCCDELERLLDTLGYAWSARPIEHPGLYPHVYRHPEGRKAIFVGDLVDRGPRILETYQLVRHMVDAGSALCVPGNHEAKLVRKLRGRDVVVNHGLEQTLAEIERLPADLREAFCRNMSDFLDGLISHYVLDDGKLVVAHAGMKAPLQGRASQHVRAFALYGETTGETDAYGLPVRHNWAAEYRGQARVVYGHTPTPEAEWLNRTINIDTGCVFGGKLTALRYPELALVSVPAARIYVDPVRPFLPTTSDVRTAQQQADEWLDLDEVVGKRAIHTRLWPTIVIRDEQSAAALEVMSRFAVDPRWLIYLPPTMSPPDPSDAPDRLEEPAQVFGYYRRQGLSQVICEEKHMGSRAIVIVCRDEAVAQRRFGIANGGMGICYTRTGRPFFADQAMESALLTHIQSALTDARFWEALGTDWVCLDCEVMPWSFKAQGLLQQQYAAVGTAGRVGYTGALAALQQAAERGLAVETLSSRYQQRATMVAHYVEAYQRYCWSVHSVQDLQLAPFHVLATEGVVHVDKSHQWHLDIINQIVAASSSPCLQMTASRVLDLTDTAAETAMMAWWEEVTAQGGEGIVVKPLEFVARGRRGLVQPAMKCRGREYLRIIYGPEYTAPKHLARLRARHLGVKRALALRECALGIEALERFVRGEPLRRVHACVFGVLALESEPVDPRL
jgi:protein phosphatase